MEEKSAETEAWRSYATICRLCLQKDGFMLGIFNNIQGKDKSIWKKIVDCTALSVHPNDGLPNVICHRCLYKIEFCLEFRQLCFLSDATLRQFHGNSENASRENESEGVSPPLFEQLVNGGGDENVVMVVDPNQMDYESEIESENENKSDPEALDLDDDVDDISDIRDETQAKGKGVSLCRFCDHAFTNYRECVNHENNSHNVYQPYSCVSCSMHFADRLLFSAHMKSVHKNDKPYNCPQCSRSFARRSDLRKHTVVHTGVKPYTCTICLKSFSRNTNLSKHMRIHSGSKPFVCQKCPRTFTSKGDLNRHAMVHTGTKPFRCRFCNMSFGRRDKMLRHEKRHLPQENREEKRENISQTSATEENKGENVPETVVDDGSVSRQDGKVEQEGAKSEENIIINLDPFHHDVASGNSEANLQKPANSGTDNNLENNEDYLKEEQQTHSEENSEDDPENNPNEEQKSVSARRPYWCLHCPKKFSNNEFLRFHMQAKHSVTGIRPFNCQYCSKSFIRKRELERHITVHTGVKPFKCPKCFKGFGRKDKLVRHIRIHDRPAFGLKNGFFGFSSPEKRRPICLTRDK